MTRRIEQLAGTGSLSLNPHGAEENFCVPIGSSEKRRLQQRIEEWRKAPEEIFKYDGDSAFDADGKSYEYLAGARLLMDEDKKEVMDTCQTPWANATVDRAFEALGNKKDVDVLERGFGMGIVATRVMDNLRRVGGTYTVIELNELVAQYAKGEWKNKQEDISIQRATSVHGGTYTGPDIEINVIEGDAYKETASLAAAGRKFDIIVSDTFPLSEEERGVNDLIDLQTLKQCLTPDGIFTFFGYFTGSQGGIGSVQRDIVNQHFEEYSVTEVMVNPPSHYKYLNPPGGPIRRLPVIICKRPKL